MDFGSLIKHMASIVTVVTASLARRKLDESVAEYRSVTGPHAAQPFLRLGFEWRDDLLLNKVYPPEIVFLIGNRENRAYVLEKIEWFCPHYRLSWDAKALDAPGQRIEPGRGMTFKCDPQETLDCVKDSGFWSGRISQVRLISQLRLKVRLESGEEVSVGAPRVLKQYLAHVHRLPILAICFIRLQSFVRPKAG